MNEQPLSSYDCAFAVGLSLLYIVLITVISYNSGYSGLSYLLFPELAALSYDVFTRPWGKWASQPWRLVITPTLTAIMGTAITCWLPYHVLTILLIVCLSMLAISLLKSKIAPAISAGTLPLVLDIKSWFYPTSILLGLIALATISTIWRRRYYLKYRHSSRSSIARIYGAHPLPLRASLWPWLIFIAIVGLCAQISGVRLILFPPLIVIAYEMFAHPDSCPWSRKPLYLPITCFLTAIGGVAAENAFSPGSSIAVGSSMAFGLIVLRGMKIHMPPALAVGLIPFIIQSPSPKYALSVCVGTLVLTFYFLLYQRLFPLSQAARQSLTDLPSGE